MKNNEIENIESKSRRKIVTGTAGTAAVLSIWSKPVINAVVTPAHAQTTVVTDSSDDSGAGSDQDFFATGASATQISIGNDGGSSTTLLNMFIPKAYAVAVISNNESVANLSFEAEAISDGNGSYAVKIAAEVVNRNERIANPVFEYGWSGTLNGLNSTTTLTGTGCSDDEDAKITSISGNTMTIEMGYFADTIELSLSDSSASLPSFPLACA